MNPLGLRPAQALAARSGRTQWVKTPPISLSARPADQTQLMIAGIFSVMRNLRRSPGARHVRAMQYEFLFIFQKDIRAGIEYRV
jgi:hypothetical protein